MDEQGEERQPTHRTARPSREAVATIGLVAVLVVAALAVGVWSQRSDGADGADGTAPVADAPTSPPTATVETPTITADPTPTPRPMGEKVPRVQQPAKPPPPPPPPPRTAEFRIGTYNILGSNHAPNGRGRAATSAGLITSRGVDVIGLQEVQRDQQGVFEANMPGFAFWPDGALGRQDYRKQIAWRTDTFERVDGGAAYYTFTSMPGIPMPWVRLRHLASGAEFYVINNHNSAGNLQRERDASTSVAIDLIRELRASGLPVFIVGDMNEHTKFFCRVAEATGMVAANGGSGSGGCTLPPRPLRVDWVMGVGASFSGYVQDGASIASGASDHYFLHADASIESVSDADGSPAG